MRKRARLSQTPSDQHDYNPDDIVSRMPDDILVSILSTLPLKDAAVTSQLSRRWRYMWHQTLKLDLEAKNKMSDIERQPRLLLPERNRFINWVNCMMRHHKSATIENFKICFDLDKHSKGAITKWVQFALSKNVVTLELDFNACDGAYVDHVKNFTFPQKILNAPKAREITCLKILILKNVNINDEAFGKILRNCPVLEYLHISNSGHLVNVSVSGPTLALTKLEIKDCFGIQSIEIYDSNLVWFEYLGAEVALKLNNNPRLDRISIGEGTSGIQFNTFKQISCVKYLRVLELSFSLPKNDMHLVSFPELPTVKKLTMIVGALADNSLLWLTRFVKACPNVEKCTIQLKCMWKLVRIERKIGNWVRHTHQHLKVVEILGYYGGTSDVELALYFYQNGVSLKKIVIDPTYQLRDKRRTIFNLSVRHENIARCYAHLMLGNIIPADKLVIL